MEVGAPLGHWPLGRLCGGDLGPAHPQEVLTATPAPELLTVGISSALHPHESHLLDALRALFQASSGPELGCVVVLVSLSDSDPEWLSQTVANISDLFQAHIEARQLLVVRAQLGGPPPLHTLRPEDLPSSCEALYSVQKADHAPQLGIFAIELCKVAHAALHRHAVAQQGFALIILGQNLPGLFSGH